MLNENENVCSGIATGPMPCYIGVKRVRAVPMTYIEYCQYKNQECEQDQNPPKDGYFVVYPDGYESWCPKAQFEEANRPVNGLSFGHAIEAAKKGMKIARAGWNGKGMWLFFVPDNGWNLLFGNTTDYKNNPFIAMKTADDKYVPWLASQTDILADDWFIVE